MRVRVLQNPVHQNCDPFVRFDFEQKTVWLNLVILIALGVFWRVVSYFAWSVGPRDRKTVYGHDEELFNRYCKKSDLDEENDDIEKNDLRNPKISVADPEFVDQNVTHDLQTVN